MNIRAGLTRQQEPGKGPTPKQEVLTMSQKIYQMITDKIIKLMGEGLIPWEKPWKGGGPKNLATGRFYKGINIWLLCTGETACWVTYKQAVKLGGQVRKGEKGQTVVFWKWIEKGNRDEKTGENTKTRYPLLRYYTVFNLSQVDGIKTAAEDKPKNNPIAEAASIIHKMPQRPKIEPGQRACYCAIEDKISIPNLNNFICAEEYYSTAFHELAHSTGHHSRLDREEITRLSPFGSHDYSKEELVAEMATAFLCGVAGIENKTIKNSASYIKSWSQKFKDNVAMVVSAAAKAQKAADFILGQHQDKD